MIKTCRELCASPICRTVAIFLVLVGTAWYFITDKVLLSETLDAFVVAGAGVYFYRFRETIFSAFREDRPSSAAMYICGVALMVGMAGIARVFRFFTTHPVGDTVAMLLAGVTSVIAISIFLLCVAPPINEGKIQLTAYAAAALALGSGAVLAMALLIGRVIFGG